MQKWLEKRCFVLDRCVVFFSRSHHFIDEFLCQTQFARKSNLCDSQCLLTPTVLTLKDLAWKGFQTAWNKESEKQEDDFTAIFCYHSSNPNIIMTAITCESYSNILIKTTLNRVPNDSEKFASISVKRVYKYDSRNFYWMLSTREYQSMRYWQKDGVFYTGFINPVLLSPFHLQRRAPERIQKKTCNKKHVRGTLNYFALTSL